MKSTPFLAAIDPLRIASRIAAARYGEDSELGAEIEKEPRIVEAMYFLAWVSNPENFPGGLRKFAADLIEDSRDLIGPLDMGPIANPKSSSDERAEWVRNLPHSVESALGVEEDSIDFGLSIGDLRDDATFCERRAAAREREAREAAERRAAVEKRTHALRALTPASIRDACADHAAGVLPSYLADVCEKKGRSLVRVDALSRYGSDGGAPPSFPRIATALFRFMDRWRERRQAKIAETVVTREVFKWLDKCAATTFPVRIEGNSRYGKTEAVQTWCAMQPGRARLVDTPSAGAEGDLLRAVARALGMVVTHRRRSPELRRDIEFILRHSQITIVFDESQWLLPSNITRNTEPQRLNWVRRSIVDAGIAAAFISTPQSYRDAQRRLVRVTGYAMEQWNERLLKTVRLPDEVPHEDLLAIARVHLAGLSSDYLEYVVSLVAATERNYVSDIAKIARLAREYARDNGRETIKLADIKAAIGDVLPAVERPAASETPQPSRHAHRSGNPLQPACNPPSRGVQPAFHATRLPAESEEVSALEPA